MAQLREAQPPTLKPQPALSLLLLRTLTCLRRFVAIHLEEGTK